MSTTELQMIVEKLAISQAETDRQMKETDRQVKNTSRSIKELRELFTGQWGKLVESLVDAGLPSLFQGAGVAVRRVSRRHEVFSENQKLAEVDILLHNGGEDIALEVKTTCRPKDVDEHIERMRKIHAAVPSYSDGGKKLYGAIAALQYDAEANLYAKRKGLFVLEGRNGLFSITNEKGFQAKAY